LTPTLHHEAYKGQGLGMEVWGLLGAAGTWGSADFGALKPWTAWTAWTDPCRRTEHRPQTLGHGRPWRRSVQLYLQEEETVLPGYAHLGSLDAQLVAEKCGVSLYGVYYEIGVGSNGRLQSPELCDHTHSQAN